jgi:hypothetical protein
MRPLHLFAAVLMAVVAGLVARTALARDTAQHDVAGRDAGARNAAAQASPARNTPGDDDSPLVVLVTGSTDGLGREVARRLAADGHHVIVHGRNHERGAALVAEIETEGRGSARFYAADFAPLDAVRGLADAVLRDYDRLDVLVNNAGIWSRGDERRTSDDGHELQFAVNYLAGYLLTHRLLPLLRGERAVAHHQRRVGGADAPRLRRRHARARLYRRPRLRSEQARAGHVHLRPRRWYATPASRPARPWTTVRVRCCASSSTPTSAPAATTTCCSPRARTHRRTTRRRWNGCGG